jgi:hypothetical protein
MVRTFTTTNGSIYKIINEGKTKRWKAATNEYFPESDKTVYLDYQDARLVSNLIAVGSWVKLKEVLIVVFGDKEDAQIEFIEEPRVCYSPFEIWGSANDPKSIHLGNIIQEVY